MESAPTERSGEGALAKPRKEINRPCLTRWRGRRFALPRGPQVRISNSANDIASHRTVIAAAEILCNFTA